MVLTETFISANLEIPTEPAHFESIISCTHTPLKMEGDHCPSAYAVINHVNLGTNATTRSNGIETRPFTMREPHQTVYSNGTDETVGVQTFDGGRIQAGVVVTESVIGKSAVARAHSALPLAQALMQRIPDIARLPKDTTRSVVEKEALSALLEARNVAPSVPLGESTGCIAITCLVSREPSDNRLTQDTILYLAGIGNAQATLISQNPSGEIRTQNLFVPQDRFLFEASLEDHDFWLRDMEEMEPLRNKIVQERLREWQQLGTPQNIRDYQSTVTQFLTSNTNPEELHISSARYNVNTLLPAVGTKAMLLVSTNAIGNMIEPQDLAHMRKLSEDTNDFAQQLKTYAETHEIQGSFAIASLTV